MAQIKKQRKISRHLSPGQKLGLVAFLAVLFAVSSTVFLDLKKSATPPRRILTGAGL